jgi:gliding motility-associated-like protein
VVADTVVIDFDGAPPAFSLGEDLVICPGDTVILQAPQTDDIILWETSDETSTETQYFATLPGVVTLTMSNHCGVVSDEILIEFDENEPMVALDPVSLCEGESLLLDAAQPFNAIYEWSTGNTSSSIQITTPGNYSVSIITECYSTESSVQVTYSADCDPQIFVPNVFSPNDDGVNDTWQVLIDPALEVTGLECKIFDRWGNTLFVSSARPLIWDGRFNGQRMQPGVYVYVLRLQIPNLIDQVMSGSITLIR